MQKVALAIILHKTKGFLFQIRKNPPYKGMIGLIGGKIESNESADEAIIREVKEETGLEAKKIKFQGVVKDYFIEKSKTIVNYLFIYTIESFGEIKENKKEGKIISLSNLKEIEKYKDKFIPSDFYIFMKCKNKCLHYHELMTKIKDNKFIFSERKFKTKKCVLIGSFRKHIDMVNKISQCFLDKNIEILSPKNCNIINPGSEFVLFDYDPPILNEGEIQTIVFKKMHIADLVYLINPEGYLGKSAAMEIGYAFANNIKVYSLNKISDMHHHFITDVCSPEELVKNWDEIIKKPNCRKLHI
jgi:ADP-ribose pyrophosphatase YjhB (NUDIX family)